MTIDKSIEIISVSGWGYTEPEIAEAVRTIREGMEYRKAKPPKPINGATVFNQAKCPTCGNLVYGTEVACSGCGQLLKWEAENG